MAHIVVDADYQRYQSELVTDLQPNVATDLPTVDNTVVKPEKIIVQNHPDSNGFIVVGQGANLPESGGEGGYFIPPGGMQILSGRDTSAWKIAGSGAGGQTAIVTYLSGAN